jgi:hypothetical protein
LAPGHAYQNYFWLNVIFDNINTELLIESLDYDFGRQLTSMKAGRPLNNCCGLK